MEKPATYPVLNSITDLNNYGDERNFFICHDLTDPGASGGGWGNTVLAQDKNIYKCQLLYDNDIAPNFDSIARPNVGENPAAMLQGARARVQLPNSSTYNPALWGVITADNTNPSEVWEACNFVAAKPITITYVPGSARLLIGGNVTPQGGVPLKDEPELTGNGTLLGDQQDGYVGQHVGYITFEVTVTLG